MTGELIARAFTVAAAAVLVLDEPTSALDPRSEQAVRETLEGLRATTAIVIIAHRLSTLQLCDRLAVLRDGRLEGVGPPESLAARGGFYRDVLAKLAGGACRK